MSTLNGKSFTNVRNLNLRGGAEGPGLLRWSVSGIYGQNSALWASNPFGSLDYGLYINSAGSLVFSSQGTTTILGAAGSGGSIPSWDQIFVGDQALDVGPTNSLLLTSSGTGSNDILDISTTAVGSGNLINLANGGSGKDISGTGATWTVDKAGAAVFVSATVPTITATTITGTTNTLTLAANGSSAVVIGTGSNTVTIAKAATLSSTVTITDGQLTHTSTSNTTPTKLQTNNTISTYGVSGDSTGQNVFRSTSLTTGTLLKLQLTEATLTTGWYLNCYSAGVGSVFTVGKAGATVITGSAYATAALTLTAGDIVVSAGKISQTAVGATTANGFTGTYNGLTSGIGMSLVHTTSVITTGSVLRVSSTGVDTGTSQGTLLDLVSSGATAATIVNLAVAALTTGIAVNVAANALTTGQVVKIAHTTSVIADGGSLVQLSSSSIDTGGATNGTLLDIKGTAQLAGTQVRIDSIQTTGTVMSIISTGIMTTTGNLLTLTANAATTGAGLLRVNGNGLTTGSGIVVASTSTGLTTGSLLSVSTGSTGAVATNGVVSLVATAAYTSTSNVGLLTLIANSTTAGTIESIFGNALTTGVALYVSGTGTYTGTGFATISATGATTGSILKVLATAATLTTGFYFAANDGGLNVFTVGSNGHLTSNQTTAPTIATNATGISAVAVTAGSTDTCGTITTTGTPASGTVLTLTFNKTYTTAPKFVIVAPANASAGGVNTMPIITQTATTFVLTWPAGGVYAATPSFTYAVIA